MFDIGWQEIIILMLIALIVVGPKDLPRVVKTAGQWMGKARGYARDFQRTIEEAADATEIDAVKKEIDEANRELANARRDLADGAETAKRDVADGAGGMNKILNEDVATPAEGAGAKPNGGATPDGGATAGTVRPTASATPKTAATDTRGNGADGSPARGASA